MSADDDVPSDVLRTYRAANALLQEQASPATRAAILAAAACADAARPAPGWSRSPPSVTAGSGWRSWLFSRNALGRLPVAAAASALVSVLAWQIAQFVPGRDDVVHSAALPAPASAPAQTATAPRPAERASRAADLASNDNALEHATHAGPASAAKMATGEASNASDARADTTTRARAVAARAGRPSPVERPSASGSANESEIAAAKLALAPKGEAPSDQVNRPVRSLASSDTSPRETESSGNVGNNTASAGEPARRSAPADVAARARAEPVERSVPVAGDTADSSAPFDLDRWIARIVQLRRAGRDTEADADLKQLRAHYPNAKLPPAVERSAIGTQ